MKMSYTYEMLRISSAFIVFFQIFVSEIDDMQQGTNLDFANQLKLMCKIKILTLLQITRVKNQCICILI